MGKACRLHLLDETTTNATQFLVLVSDFGADFKHLLAVLRTRAFRSHHHGKATVVVETTLQAFFYDVDVVRELGQQTHLCPTRDGGM